LRYGDDIHAGGIRPFAALAWVFGISMEALLYGGGGHGSQPSASKLARAHRLLEAAVANDRR
jgi:hypothetical protein